MELFQSYISNLLTRYLPRGSFRDRYFRGTYWMVLGTGVAQASTFIATIIAARMLGSRVFGQYGILVSSLALLYIFAGIGTGVTNKRFVGELRDTDPVQCGQIIGFSAVISSISSIVLATILFLFAPWLAHNILGLLDFEVVLRLAAGLLLLTGLNEAQVGVLAGMEEFRKIAVINFTRAPITFFSILIGVWFWGLTGMIAGMALTSFVVWICSIYFMKTITRKANILVSYNYWHRYLYLIPTFIIPVLASGILPAFVFWVIRTMLIPYPNGFSEVGVFTAAEQWITITAIIPGQMNSVSQPILSNIYATGDWARFRKAVYGNILLPLAFAIALSAFVILITDWVHKIYGESFSGLNIVLILMCFVGVLRVFGGSVGALLITINKMWLSFGINVIWGIILIASAYLLIPMGAKGLAYANLLAYAFLASAGLLILYLFNNSFIKMPYVNGTIS